MRPWRWLRILAAGRVPPGQINVFYGYDRLPDIGERVVRGGIVKFQRMQEFFPNSPRSFNILYMGSSSMPADWPVLLRLARQRGARVVWNQNGVAYPGWHGPGWETVNAPMRKMLHASDHVFYQSHFCKLSADRFLGSRSDSWEVLYNPVDTSRFAPPRQTLAPSPLVILLGGNQFQYSRLESAIRTIALVVRERSDAQLRVTGHLSSGKDEAVVRIRAMELARDLGVAGSVFFLGPYTQEQAPDVFGGGHLLLHTKYNDPCPNLVIEALACGLPVVYSGSGGVPELVGSDAGIGIPAPVDWERDHLPDPAAMAAAVLRVAGERDRYAEAARQRAVDLFDVRPWVRRHGEVFESLLS